MVNLCDTCVGQKKFRLYGNLKIYFLHKYHGHSWFAVYTLQLLYFGNILPGISRIYSHIDFKITVYPIFRPYIPCTDLIPAGPPSLRKPFLQRTYFPPNLSTLFLTFYWLVVCLSILSLIPPPLGQTLSFIACLLVKESTWTPPLYTWKLD